MLRLTSLTRAGFLLSVLGSALSVSPAAAQGRPDFVPGRVLVAFRANSGQTRLSSVSALAGARAVGKVHGTDVQVMQLAPGANELATVRALAQRPDVAFAEVDRIYAPTATPNDSFYSSQWHLPKVSAPAAWDANTGSAGVTIAILDSGVDATHPDLAPKMVPGWNFFEGNANTADVFGHGTKVAGAATACSNNGAGVAGMAWGCKIMPIRITDAAGYATTTTITNGLYWAADNGARVANVSFEASTSAIVQNAATYFEGKGGVVTMSSGNRTYFEPAVDAPSILTIGATDANDAKASWSNTGNNLDLTAPGVNIYTTTMGGGYANASGTSFAAPITAGTAALILSANPNLSAAEVRSILKDTADDKGTAGLDTQFGTGRLNAARAVSRALTGTGTGTADSLAPTVNITSPAPGAYVSGTVAVQVAASDNVGVASVTFSVDGVAKGTDTTAPYSFDWNTLTAANGGRVIRATATDTSGNTANFDMLLTVQNVVAADVTAPSVRITSPGAGSYIGRNVTIYASATDNVNVARVELYVNGQFTSSSTLAPFTTTWNSRFASYGAHTLQLKAIDTSGNAAWSAPVTVYK